MHTRPIVTADTLAARALIRRGGLSSRDIRTLRRSAQASRVIAARRIASDVSALGATLRRLETLLGA